MSCLTILRFQYTTALNRYLLKKCLYRYRTYQPKIYCLGHNPNKSPNSKERIAKSKAFKAQILQDIKHTTQKIEEIKKENIYTIPNLLSLGRIATSPFLSYLIFSHDYQIALWLLAIASISDLADGWIARTWTSQASILGSFLDPAADKLLLIPLFGSLTYVGLIPAPLGCLVIIRDFALICAASYIRYLSLPPPKTLAKYFDPKRPTVQLAPTFISKLNTGVQLSMVAGTLAAPVFHFVDHPLLQGLYYLTACTTLAGGISYLLSKNTYKLLTKKNIST